MTFKDLIPILLQVSMAFIVFALALDSTTPVIKDLLNKPGLILRSLLAMNVIVPCSQWRSPLVQFDHQSRLRSSPSPCHRYLRLFRARKPGQAAARPIFSAIGFAALVSILTYHWRSM
jgi:hypothetical protein